jgi:hypothetical protein
MLPSNDVIYVPELRKEERLGARGSTEENFVSLFDNNPYRKIQSKTTYGALEARK